MEELKKEEFSCGAAGASLVFNPTPRGVALTQVGNGLDDQASSTPHLYIYTYLNLT